MWTGRGFDEFEEVRREMDRAFAFGLWSGFRRRLWRPPTDVYETDSHVVIKVEIAGMREEDFQICLADRVLTISGYREDPADKLAYQRMEINYGNFLIEVNLPWPLREDDVEASYADGFLVVKVRKAGRTQVPITRVDI